MERMGDEPTGNEIRCPESEGENEVRNTKTAMGQLH